MKHDWRCVVRRALLIVVLFTSVAALAEAQKIMTMNVPDNPGPPFTTQLRKMVVFIELTCTDSGNARLFTGTGFLVAYQHPQLRKDQHFDYLVTNRHVAECWDDQNQPRVVESVRLRVNLKNGSSKLADLSQQGNIHWYFASDDSVDLAVTPITLSPDVEVLAIPLGMFVTKDFFAPNYVGEGAKIILAGFFYQFAGERRLQPLIREGILSMMPDEPLKTTTGKRGTVYLGDVHIFGGNSGSPVFIDIAGLRPNGVIQLDDYRFLGTVSGYYYEDSDFNLEIATTVKGKQRANSGVSMIVPADLLKDLILNDSDLKRMRDSQLPKSRQD
jgi:hypothetical protein